MAGTFGSRVSQVRRFVRRFDLGGRLMRQVVRGKFVSRVFVRRSVEEGPTFRRGVVPRVLGSSGLMRFGVVRRLRGLVGVRQRRYRLGG